MVYITDRARCKKKRGKKIIRSFGNVRLLYEGHSVYIEEDRAIKYPTQKYMHVIFMFIFAVCCVKAIKTVPRS